MVLNYQRLGKDRPRQQMRVKRRRGGVGTIVKSRMMTGDLAVEGFTVEKSTTQQG
jgi:hypothetical protein